jgi:hypothetical protein
MVAERAPTGGHGSHPDRSAAPSTRLRALATVGGGMATDLVIEVDNEPGALARVATAVSDGGVNLSAATCTSPGARAQLHILVKHPEAAKHALATAGVTVTSEREVVVVEASDRPGELADLTTKVAAAGVNLDLVYVATGTRIVLGSPDLDALRAALGIEAAVPA